MLLNTSRWEIVMKTTGLTLREAIESGKSIKRSDYPQWYHCTSNCRWSTDDVLSTNWELKVEPREWEVFVTDDRDPSEISYRTWAGSVWRTKKIRVREIL